VPGDEEYAQRLLNEGRAALGDRLILLGHVNELRDFYNGLDLFVNTSQEEACSISVIESLACGCPLLGYPSKSVDDQVLPDGGEIVEQDNVQQLAVRLDGWTANADLLSGRRSLARRQAEDRFDIRKLANQLWDEYESMLTERSASRRRGASSAC
jgi:glycosyltransferase involved in cell wall biosynthesis